VVVGDGIGLLSLFGDQANSFGDLKELKFVVEVIIPGIPPSVSNGGTEKGEGENPDGRENSPP